MRKKKIQKVKEKIIECIRDHKINNLKKYFSVEGLSVKMKLWMINNVIKAWEDTHNGERAEYDAIFLESTPLAEASTYLYNKLSGFHSTVSLLKKSEIIHNIDGVKDVDSLLKVYNTIHDLYNTVHEEGLNIGCCGLVSADFGG